MFALYGKTHSLKPEQMVNYARADRDNGVMYVEIKFEHHGHRYRLHRSVKFRQTNTGNEITTYDHKLEIFEGNQKSGDDDGDDWIQHILPPEISQLFIFDGEQIQAYIKQTAESLKTPIEIILGLKELHNAEDDIKGVCERTASQYDDLLAKQARKGRQLKNIKKEISKLETHLKYLDWQKNGAVRSKNEAEEQLKRQEKTKDLIKECEQQKQLLSYHQKDANTTLGDLRKHHGNFGLILLSPLIRLLDNNIQIKTENWQTDIAHRILQSNSKCLCGREIDTEMRQNLRALVDQPRNQLPDLQKQFNIILNLNTDKLLKDYAETLSRNMRARNSLKKCSEKLDNIEMQIKKIGNNDAQTIFKNANQQFYSADADIKRFTTGIDTAEKQLTKEREKLRSLIRDMESDSLSLDLNEKKMALQLTENIVKAIKDVKTNFYEKRMPDLERYISNIFLQLTNNPDLYRGISIEKDFSIRIKRNDGKSLLINTYPPSAGGSQIVATAVITGLNKFATRDAPIIIDTPLGRLDQIHKKRIIKYYSEMGKQVIILYHSSELSDDEIQSIYPNIASEWKIVNRKNQPNLSDITLWRSYI